MDILGRYAQSWATLKEYNAKRKVEAMKMKKLKQYPILKGFGGYTMLSDYMLARLFLRFDKEEK